jgi:hypothetical protein
LLLFAAHDPGAKNHILPIYNKAVMEGNETKFVDLMSNQRLLHEEEAIRMIKGYRPDLLVSGSSMNQDEGALVGACRLFGIPSVSVVDISIEGKFNGRPADKMPDLLLVTNKGCIAELGLTGTAHPEAIVVGSTHLEKLVESPPNLNKNIASRFYGIPKESALLAFFCIPDSAYSINAVNSLEALLPTTQLRLAKIIVRPHPRMPNKRLLEDACDRLSSFIFDGKDYISTPELTALSRMTLSMASTVSLESIVLGVPSAFYQIGWDYAYHDALYNNVEGVRRIRSADDLTSFIDQAMLDGNQLNCLEIEHCIGAMDRTWKALAALVPSIQKTTQ